MNAFQFDREEQLLEDALNDERISQEEFNAELREMRREYRASCDEACDAAYERERSNW